MKGVKFIFIFYLPLFLCCKNDGTNSPSPSAEKEVISYQDSLIQPTIVGNKVTFTSGIENNENAELLVSGLMNLPYSWFLYLSLENCNECYASLFHALRENNPIAKDKLFLLDAFGSYIKFEKFCKSENINYNSISLGDNRLQIGDSVYGGPFFVKISRDTIIEAIYFPQKFDTVGVSSFIQDKIINSLEPN
jgi:hypothetical protein